MPIEIRELQLTTVVQDGKGTGSSANTSAPASANNDAVIAACVEQVLEILKQKIER
jgi:hypothetical protein